MNINVKRAGTNVGIGRELYTPLFIWINGLAENDKFKVSEIGYNDKREIDKLTIVNDKGIQAFKLGAYKAPDKQTPTTEQPKTTPTELIKGLPTELPKRSISDKQIARLYAIGNSAGLDAGEVAQQIKTKLNKTPEELTRAEYDKICIAYEGLKKGDK